VSALLAAAPALPLHEAGKYVAGAYVVLVAIVLIYVAIMATRLRRMQRQLGELNAALEMRERGERRPDEPEGSGP
jgi:Flp pilus assembly protein TadB